MISLIQTVVNRSEEPQYSAISPSRSFYSLERTFSFGSSRSRTRYLGVLPVKQNEPYIGAGFYAFGYQEAAVDFSSNSRKPSGTCQMLPLCTPEYRQGYRQLLPFLLNKPFKQILNKSENFRSDFSECFTQGSWRP